ncbi:MAG: hypothetical protein MUF86_07310 [Akkermansiaceae bacterium]|jgi:hypothetical protein|nr:hypothetical protein [Akkermansiaceae bacterium]MCU0777461.1 hypothetical protein [Akkermansiaceae bacterium]
MPAPSEPEKYSIDEMMDRLKNRPDEEPLEDGELVIRADGSRAIKVRKRKRRSHQPHKELLKKTRRARMIQVAAALLLILMAAFAVASAIVYSNSAPFREGVIRMIRETAGAEVQLEEFRVNPSNAVAGRLVLKWPDGGILRDLTVRGISASISPAFFFGKSIQGEEVNSSEGTLNLGAPSVLTPPTPGKSPEKPSPIHFKRYAIPRLSVRMGDPARPAATLYESEASYQADSNNGRPQLLLNRGQILQPGWPKLRMDRAHIEFRDREIDLVFMRLLHENDSSGMMELVGTVSPYNTDRPSTLDIRMASFLLSGIAGPDLGQIFAGRVDTRSKVKSNYLAFTPGSETGVTLAVTFRNALNSSLEVQGFPFLTHLALMLGDNWYDRPAFETEATGTLRRQGAVVTLEDLHLEQKARMALRGNLTLAADRRLNGTLTLGLPEAMIKSSGHPKLEAMFGPDDGGFRWLTLKISGSGVKPADNFLEIADATRPAKPSPPPEGKVPSFEDLTVPE